MIGQHLRVRKAGRWIHAIDCGDETVLHLGEETPRRVRRAYRPEFVAGAEVVEPVLHRERTFAPKEIVQRAYSRAADTTLAAMFSDSESFAEWCATGRLPGPRNFAVEAAPAPAAAPAPPKPAPKPAARAKAPAKAKAAVKAKAPAEVKAKANAPAKTRAKVKARPAAKAKAAPKRAAAKPAKAAKAAKKSAGRKPATRRAAKARRPASRGKR